MNNTPSDFERVMPFEASHTFILQWYDGPLESLQEISDGMMLVIALSFSAQIVEDLCIPMSYKDFFLYSNRLISFFEVMDRADFIYNQVQLYRDVSKSVPETSTPFEKYILLDYYAEKYDTKTYIKLFPENFPTEDRYFEIGYDWSEKEKNIFNKLLSKIESCLIKEDIVINKGRKVSVQKKI